jgi:hypothetical protein
MEGVMKSDDACALQQSTQNLRTLWEGVISRDYIFVIAINAAIWTYLLRAYIESFSTPSNQGFSYLAVAAGLSSIMLGLWRLYTRYIYNRIAGLYPDLLLYEKILGIEPDHGTTAYLVGTIPRLRRLLSGERLNPNQKGEAISYLVAEKRMGRLSHIIIDIIVLGIIISLFGLCISLYSKVQLLLATGSLVVTIIGFLLVICSIFAFQRYPSQSIITAALRKYGEELEVY